MNESAFNVRRSLGTSGRVWDKTRLLETRPDQTRPGRWRVSGGQGGRVWEAGAETAFIAFNAFNVVNAFNAETQRHQSVRLFVVFRWSHRCMGAVDP
jgi:phage-related tail fiber protein